MIESFFIFLSSIISLIYQEDDFLPLFVSASIAAITGLLAVTANRSNDRNIGKREGYVIVSLVWVIFSLFGALPFYFSQYIPSYTDAFFETISGFTTTGASILDMDSMSMVVSNPDDGSFPLPHGLLFWRSITQWLGGMGIIVLSLAVLPMLGIGGMQLFVAEVPGPTPDKLHPKIKETAKRLWVIYLLFTLAEAILLFIGGMTIFDAICHAFTTMATGGYSNKTASIAYYDSAFIQYVIVIFMFIAGTNFTLSYFALKMKFKKIWKNEEFKYYGIFTIFFTLLIFIRLLASNGTFSNLEILFRDSLFQVVSIMTTTGFATVDYLLWGAFPVMIIFMLMFFGGSAGSTGGSMKIVRVLLLIKNGYLELKRLIHPNAIIPTRLNNHTVNQKIMMNILAFIVLYVGIFVIGTVIMAIMLPDIDTAMGAVAATLGNIGPGIGEVGPASNFANIPDIGKWFLSILMLIGRLELFTVLVILSPAFWKR
jgi:trk system potassium uptake protein TrkH